MCCLTFGYFSFVCIRQFHLFLDHVSSYRYKLDSVGPVHQNQQQIRLNIHTCTIQRCYCRYDWLHKHLMTGIHLNLESCKNK